MNRNTLNLRERAEVIREYDLQTSKPNIQNLATKYNVSYHQIKNVIRNRDTILKAFAESSSRAAALPNNEFYKDLQDENDRQFQDKVDFLGNVMYEYLKRAIFQNVSINDAIMLQKALEMKNCIDIPNFLPTSKWLRDFKEKFNIPLVDVSYLYMNIMLSERRQSLLPIDLLTYVTYEEKKKKLKNTKYESDAHPVFKVKLITPTPAQVKLSEDISQNVACNIVPVTAPIPVLNNDCKSENLSAIDSWKEEYITPNLEPTIIKFDYDSTEENCMSEPESKKICITCGGSSGEIKTFEDATKHLRLLEEFAMLQDNYRAIGLLTQLEKVLKEPLSLE